MAVGDFISGGLGLGNMIFGAGERARQQTAEHNAAMVDAEKMRMSPWLSAAAQAPTQRTKVESPGGALMGGATSLWAQLQAGQAAEEAKAERLAAQKVNQDMLAQSTRRNDIMDKQYAAPSAPKQAQGPYSLAMLYPGR